MKRFFCSQSAKVFYTCQLADWKQWHHERSYFATIAIVAPFQLCSHPFHTIVACMLSDKCKHITYDRSRLRFCIVLVLVFNVLYIDIMLIDSRVYTFDDDTSNNHFLNIVIWCDFLFDFLLFTRFYVWKSYFFSSNLFKCQLCLFLFPPNFW